MSEFSLHPGNKAGIHDALKALAAAEGKALDETVERIYHPDARWYGSHPINELEGTDAIKDVWQTLRRSFPDMERRDSIFLVGESGSRQYAASVGIYQSNFATDWLGVPATHGVAHLRYGEVHELVDGRIRHTYALWDLLDLLAPDGHLADRAQPRRRTRMARASHGRRRAPRRGGRGTEREQHCADPGDAPGPVQV